MKESTKQYIADLEQLNTDLVASNNAHVKHIAELERTNRGLAGEMAVKTILLQGILDASGNEEECDTPELESGPMTVPFNATINSIIAKTLIVMDKDEELVLNMEEMLSLNSLKI